MSAARWNELMAEAQQLQARVHSIYAAAARVAPHRTAEARVRRELESIDEAQFCRERAAVYARSAKCDGRPAGIRNVEPIA